jgi:hypothetical protein
LSQQYLPDRTASNYFTEIITIMPATRPKSTANAAGLNTLARITYPRIAAMGSERPERQAHSNACHFFPCSIVNGHGHTEAFRDIVERNGYSQHSTNSWVVKSSHKRGKAFWEVVQCNGNCSIHTHPHEFALIFRVCFFIFLLFFISAEYPL